MDIRSHPEPNRRRSDTDSWAHTPQREHPNVWGRPVEPGPLWDPNRRTPTVPGGPNRPECPLPVARKTPARTAKPRHGHHRETDKLPATMLPGKAPRAIAKALLMTHKKPVSVQQRQLHISQFLAPRVLLRPQSTEGNHPTKTKRAAFKQPSPMWAAACQHSAATHHAAQVWASRLGPSG